MSHQLLDRLPYPKRKYNIIHLCPRIPCPIRSEAAGREVIVGFEERKATKAEDYRRRAMASTALLEFPERLNAEWVKELILALRSSNGRTPATLASSFYMRKYRIYVTGALLALTDEATIPVKAFTLLSQRWVVPAEELSPDRIKSIMKSFRNYVERLDVDEIHPGFVFAALDGDYDEAIDAFVLHLHGAVGGDYVDAFDKELRYKRAFAKSDLIARPLKLYRIKEPAKQVSYFLKSFWSQVDSDTEPMMHPRRRRRVSEPMSTHYLSVLNQLTLSDTICMVGLEVHSYGFWIVKNHVEIEEA